MVHCNILTEFFVPIEEGELNNPEKVVFILRNDVELLSYRLSESTEYTESCACLVSYDKDNVTVFSTTLIHNSFHLVFCHKFSK